MFAKRAMLVELTIRQWTARKNDKSATYTVQTTFQTGDAGRYNKQLIAKQALDAINSKANAIRTFHYKHTLPWGNKGQHLLPAKRFFDYRQGINQLRSEFNDEVQKFLDRYEHWVDEARNRLGSLFDPTDYPTSKELSARFGVDLDILPVPTSGDFRVEVANEERQELITQIEAASQERQANANRACYDRVRDVLQRMKQQCVPGKTRITDSLVDDVRELTNVLDDLNVNDDPELIRINQEIRRDLLTDAEALRRSPTTRAAVGDRAAEILESISWG